MCKLSFAEFREVIALSATFTFYYCAHEPFSRFKIKRLALDVSILIR